MVRKSCLVVSLVMLVSGVSFAEEWTPTIREVDNGNDNVVTYIVGLHVDVKAGGITSIWDTNIRGDVCQVFPFDYVEDDHVPTPLEVKGRLVDENTFEYTDLLVGLGDNRILDTHLLDLRHYSDSGNVMTIGEGWTELNDGSNPAQIGASELGNCLAGEGDMLLIHETTIAICNPFSLLDHIEFAQVVMPKGGSCVVTGRCTNPYAAIEGTTIDYRIEIEDEVEAVMPLRMKLFMAKMLVYDSTAVPEPSALAMLIFGALCLVGARFRRK